MIESSKHTISNPKESGILRPKFNTESNLYMQNSIIDGLRLYIFY